ncbi:hypothetical protein [Nonomuraea dietziae]
MAAEIVEYELTELWEGFLAEPAAGSGGAGVLTLSGSSASGAGSSPVPA